MIRLSPLRAALLLPLLASLACVKGATTAGTAKYRAGDYQPLAVGNEWTYTGKMMGQPVEQTIRITGVKDGYFVDNANGMLRVDSGGLRDAKRYLLAEPLAPGKSWTSIVSVASTEHYEVVQMGFTASVPAGTFQDCVLVRATNRIDKNREMQLEWTYAPGVGMVRMVTAVRFQEKLVPQGQLELKSHKLAAAPAGAADLHR